jgi:hypothetical protein
MMNLKKSFTQAEVLTSFSCSNCKLTKEAKKQLTMKNLPIVCCFHLKVNVIIFFNFTAFFESRNVTFLTLCENNALTVSQI